MRRMEAKLYVGNLPFTSTEEELRTLFEQAGQVTAVDLIKDRDTGRSKGFAFVTMATDESARAAIRALNGASLHGVVIKVEEAWEEGAGGRAGSGGKP